MSQKLFVVSVQAARAERVREFHGGVGMDLAVQHRATTIFAESDEEARKRAMKLAKERLPSSEGWTGHSIFVGEVPATTIAEAASATQE